MKRMISGLLAALVLSVGTLSSDTARAATFNIGSTVDLTSGDCITAVGCSLFGTPSALGTTGFDLAWWTFTGPLNTTVNLGITAAVDTQVIITAGSPIGPTGAGGLAFFNFQAGVNSVVPLAFGSGPLTLNTITPSGSWTDVAGVFTNYTSFVGGGGGGNTGGGGSGGTGGSGGSGGGTVSPVPLPAGVWLLLGGLGGLAALRRRNKT